MRKKIAHSRRKIDNGLNFHESRFLRSGSLDKAYSNYFFSNFNVFNDS
jgi:hypothetical protein